jgi:antitoxin MazE
MKVRVKKWGNSLAIRIPKSVVADANLQNDTQVDIIFMEGKIVLNPIPTEQFSLEKLVAGITKENIHEEVDTGPAIGKEVG